jgi:hypothetical protein
MRYAIGYDDFGDISIAFFADDESTEAIFVVETLVIGAKEFIYNLIKTVELSEAALFNKNELH